MNDLDQIRQLFQEAIDITSEYEERYGGAYPEGEPDNEGEREIRQLLKDVVSCRERLIAFARRME